MFIKLTEVMLKYNTKINGEYSDEPIETGKMRKVYIAIDKIDYYAENSIKSRNKAKSVVHMPNYLIKRVQETPEEIKEKIRAAKVNEIITGGEQNEKK